MRTVHKYPLGEDTTIAMPRGAQLLRVANQVAAFQLWAMVETKQPLEQRRFCVFGTGHEIKEPPLAYIGTIDFDAMVFHVFEMKA